MLILDIFEWENFIFSSLQCNISGNIKMESKAVDRITVALKTLKDDLIEMRNIDILLLRQLLYIQETIQCLMRSKTMIRTQSCQNCLLNNNKLSRITSFKEDKSITRQQSMPAFCNLSRSCDSLEDTVNSMKGIFYLAESDEDLYTEDILGYSENINEGYNISNDDFQKYEDILKNNIQEWKSNSVLISNRDSSYTVNSMKGIFYLAESDEDLYTEDILEYSENINEGYNISNDDFQKYEDILKNNIQEWKSNSVLYI